MNILTIKRIDYLIQLKSTGSPKELAAKLECSERMVYSYLKFLKEELDAPVEFNHSINSYHYTKEGTLTFQRFVAKET